MSGAHHRPSRCSLPPDARNAFDALVRSVPRETAARSLGISVWTLTGLEEGGMAQARTVDKVCAALGVST